MPVSAQDQENLARERLVRVGSFWSRSQADLAVARLEIEGIPAALDGGTLLQMSWCHANAIGGVKILTLERHASEAVPIVASLERVSSSDEVVRCETCGEYLPPAWTVCWKCAPREQIEVSAETIVERRLDEDRALFAQMAIGGLLIIFRWFGAFALISVEILALAVWASWKRAPEDTGWQYDEAEEDTEADDLRYVEDQEIANEALERAWRAAMFGLISLVLGIYACVLLIDSEKYLQLATPWQRWRWLLSGVIAFLPSALLLVLLLAVFADYFSIWEKMVFNDFVINRMYVGR